jgi:hypothetical protein
VLIFRLQVHSARKRGALLEAVQLLADLDLSVKKAYVSWDGRWFMDVFHVTDRFGRKLTDGVIAYIQQVVRRCSLLADVCRSRKWSRIFLTRFLDLVAVCWDLDRAVGVASGGARGADGAGAHGRRPHGAHL